MEVTIMRNTPTTAWPRRMARLLAFVAGAGWVFLGLYLVYALLLCFKPAADFTLTAAEGGARLACETMPLQINAFLPRGLISLHDLAAIAPKPASLLYTWAQAILQPLPGAWLLHCLARIAGDIAAGDSLCEGNARLLSQMGIVCLLKALLARLLLAVLLSVCLRVPIAFQITLDGMAALAGCGLLLASRVVREGARLREEVESTV